MEDKIKTKLKNEIISFIDLHEWTENAKTAALYASLHLLYYIADNYNIRTTDIMRLRLQATFTKTLETLKRFLSRFA